MPRHWETASLFLILLLAAFLRLYHVRTTPAWFTDEATHLDIAQHMIDGEWQYMAVTRSVLYFGRPPLFDILLAGLISLFGFDIVTLRTFTGLLGVSTVGLLWLVTRRLSGNNQWLALLAGGSLAIYPHAVLYSRFGFSYNLLAPLTLLVLLGLGEYWKTGARPWLALAALCIGIGGVSDLMMFSCSLPLMMVVLARHRQDVWQGVLLILLPFAVYAIWMLVSEPDAFVFDLRYTATRVSSVPLRQQLWNTTYNYTVLLSDGFWIAGGLTGMIVLFPRHLGGLAALLFLSPVFLIGRITSLYSLSFYYMIPVLPLAVLGMAGLIFWMVPLALDAVRQGVSGGKIHRHRAVTDVFSYSLVLLVIGAPFIVTADLDRQHVQGHWPTGIDPFLISPADADRTAGYLNSHIRPGDIVIASAPIAWQVKAWTVDFAMSAATTAGDWVQWGNEQALPLARFHHNPHYTRARFVVVDNLWRAWGVPNAPGIDTVLAEVTQWPLVFQSGVIMVYENPELAGVPSRCALLRATIAALAVK